MFDGGASVTPSGGASTTAQTVQTSPHPPVSDGQKGSVNRLEPAIGGDVRKCVAEITEKHRRREDMIRARRRLELQGQSVCRRYCGDKIAGAKLWTAVRKDEGHEMRAWLWPYLAAMEPLLEEQKAVEKQLVKLVRQLPVYPWAVSVKGFGDLSLAGIVGECAAPIGEYKSVAAVWKRMGLGVIDGQRQRKIANDKAAAIEHGYNCQRRAVMWVIGDCLIKAGGEYKAIYDERKPHEVARCETAIHAHRSAHRFMTKRLLRNLYAAWRRAELPT